AFSSQLADGAERTVVPARGQQRGRLLVGEDVLPLGVGPLAEAIDDHFALGRVRTGAKEGRDHVRSSNGGIVTGVPRSAGLIPRVRSNSVIDMAAAVLSVELGAPGRLTICSFVVNRMPHFGQARRRKVTVPFGRL